MITKNADAKGRVTLGPMFANKTVIIEPVDETEVRVIAATTVPDRELWLYQNKKAAAAVEQGLAQARAGEFSQDPPEL